MSRKTRTNDQDERWHENLQVRIPPAQGRTGRSLAGATPPQASSSRFFGHGGAPGNSSGTAAAVSRAACRWSWAGPVEGNSALESQAIMLDALWGGRDGDLVRRAAQRLLETQLPQGGWAVYPGGRPDTSLSVQAYFALKLSGQDPGGEPLYRARRAILALGGADAADGLTRYWLALLGQIPYGSCPAIPPEIALWTSGGLFGRPDPLGTHGLGAWSKTLLAALSIVSVRQPVHRIDPRRGVRELFVAAPEQWRPCQVGGSAIGSGTDGGRSPFWKRLAVRLLISWLKSPAATVAQECPTYSGRRMGILARRHAPVLKQLLAPLRRRAIRAAEARLVQRLPTGDGTWGHGPAIFWTLAALRALGYADDSPEVGRCRRQIEASIVELPASRSIRVQPCQLPAADTASRPAGPARRRTTRRQPGDPSCGPLALGPGRRAAGLRPRS